MCSLTYSAFSDHVVKALYSAHSWEEGEIAERVMGFNRITFSALAVGQLAATFQVFPPSLGPLFFNYHIGKLTNRSLLYFTAPLNGARLPPMSGWHCD